MKKKLIFGMISALLIASSLSGCMLPAGAANKIRNEIQSELETKMEENTNYNLDMQNQSGLIPDIHQSIEAAKDHPLEHRETVTYTGNQEKKLLVEGEKVNNIILRPASEYTDDTYTFSYDPEYFEVSAKPEEADQLQITVSKLKKTPNGNSSNFRVFITVPRRTYEKISIDGKRAGFTVLDFNSPVEIEADDSGLAISGLTNTVDISTEDSGIALEIPADYASKFHMDGKNLGLSLCFNQGEPENISFTLESEESMVVSPSSWKQGMKPNYTYTKGNEGAEITFSLKNSAAAITIKE